MVSEDLYFKLLRPGFSFANFFLNVDIASTVHEKKTFWVWYSNNLTFCYDRVQNQQSFKAILVNLYLTQCPSAYSLDSPQYKG